MSILVGESMDADFQGASESSDGGVSCDAGSASRLRGETLASRLQCPGCHGPHNRFVLRAPRPQSDRGGEVPLVARVSPTGGDVCRCQPWLHSRSVSSAEWSLSPCSRHWWWYGQASGNSPAEGKVRRCDQGATRRRGPRSSSRSTSATVPVACSERVAIAELAKSRDDAELGSVPLTRSQRWEHEHSESPAGLRSTAQAR